MMNLSTSIEIQVDLISLNLSRTKSLKTEERRAVAAEVCKSYGITAIVIIGGDDLKYKRCSISRIFCRTQHRCSGDWLPLRQSMATLRTKIPNAHSISIQPQRHIVN